MSTNTDLMLSGFALRAAGFLLLLLMLSMLLISCSRQPQYPEARRSADSVVLDASALQPEVPAYYSYSHNGIRINFFIVKLDDRVVSFLDACMKCYAKKLGFRSENGMVVCRSCNEKYPVTEIEKGFGSCYPVKIEGRLDGTSYSIPAETLERVGERFFR
jgi:uncharacterized membrane protein